MSVTNDTKLKKYEDVLMRAFNFTEDDLSLNAAGQMSAAQMNRLKTQRTSKAILVAALSLIVVGLLLFVNVYARLLSPLIMIFLSFILFAVLIGALPALHLTRDLQAGVKVAEGRIELDTLPRRNRTVYVVKLDGKKFRVRKMMFLAIKNGDPYRIYYAPHSQMILSVEWLRIDDPFVNRGEDHTGQPITAPEDQALTREKK